MTESEVPDLKPEKKNLSKILKLLLLIGMGIGTIGLTAFVIKQNPEVLGLSKGQANVQSEIDVLLAEVGKLISLPLDERPTVATVSDAEKIRAQAFFKDAQNGDKVIIYTNGRRAILYRPNEKKIVEVGSVNINHNRQEATSSGIPNTQERLIE